MDTKKDSEKAIKTAMLNTIANAISLVVGMIMIPVITRVLSTSEMGVASTFISTRNTFVIISTMAIYSYMHRAMLEFKYEKERFVCSLVVFCFCSIFFAFLICFPFKHQLMEWLSLDDFLYNWLFVSSLTFALYSIGNYYCIFHNKSVIVFIIVLAVGPASQFLSWGLAYVYPQKKYIGRVLGLDFVYCIVAICVVLWMLISSNRKPAVKYIKQALQFTIPIIPHLLSQMILTQCDLIMISYFAGEDKTGIYSMGHTVGFLAFTVMSQIMAVWSPWVLRRLDECDYDSIYRNSGIILLVGGYMTIGLLTVATELIKIFLPIEYLLCIYIVPPLVLAMFFQFMYLFFYDLEYYHKKSKYIATASIVAAVLNVIMNWICIPQFGYIAACYTTVASYFVLLLLNYIFCRKLNVQNIYNLKNFFALTLFIIGYTIFVLATINFVPVRYVALVLITLVLLKYQWKNIILLWENMRGN